MLFYCLYLAQKFVHMSQLLNFDTWHGFWQYNIQHYAALNICKETFKYKINVINFNLISRQNVFKEKKHERILKLIWRSSFGGSPGLRASSADVISALPDRFVIHGLSVLSEQEHILEFFLNYQQHKVDRYGNYFFPHFSFAKFVI